MYRAIIFDLDNTLLDYDKCELDAMQRTCRDHGLFLDQPEAWESFWHDYRSCSYKYWTDFVNGGNTKSIHEVLRFAFRDALASPDIEHSRLGEAYWAYFCHVIHWENGAEQLLSDIHSRYDLGMITNGISESQRKRLLAGGIHDRFRSIIISDEVGFRKPQREIFELALLELDAKPHEVLFVGDSIEADYQGALRAGVDFCYYNRDGKPTPDTVRPRYEISRLSDLKDEILTIGREEAAE
jgi:YjjG family noncanonical pyrimidine nucleotidase